MKKAAVMLRTAFSEIRFSSVYQTKAMEVETQEDFLNAVARAETKESSEEILKVLRSIEQALKKNPPYRYGPRTIDLDLLLYDDVVSNAPALTIPHAGMQGRRFVLEPLSELIDVNTTHPILKTSWQEFLKNVRDQLCRKTDLIL